jgi:hypothetical protein
MCLWGCRCAVGYRACWPACQNMPRAPLQRAEEKKEDLRLATATTMAGDSAVSEGPRRAASPHYTCRAVQPPVAGEHYFGVPQRAVPSCVSGVRFALVVRVKRLA